MTNISQIGSFPQVGVKIEKNIWDRHLDIVWPSKVDLSSVGLVSTSLQLTSLQLMEGFTKAPL